MMTASSPSPPHMQGQRLSLKAQRQTGGTTRINPPGLDLLAARNQYGGPGRCSAWFGNARSAIANSSAAHGSIYFLRSLMTRLRLSIWTLGHASSSIGALRSLSNKICHVADPSNHRKEMFRISALIPRISDEGNADLPSPPQVSNWISSPFTKQKTKQGSTVR